MGSLGLLLAFNVQQICFKCVVWQSQQTDHSPEGTIKGTAMAATRVVRISSEYEYYEYYDEYTTMNSHGNIMVMATGD